MRCIAVARDERWGEILSGQPRSLVEEWKGSAVISNLGDSGSEPGASPHSEWRRPSFYQAPSRPDHGFTDRAIPTIVPSCRRGRKLKLAQAWVATCTHLAVRRRNGHRANRRASNRHETGVSHYCTEHLVGALLNTGTCRDGQALLRQFWHLTVAWDRAIGWPQSRPRES